MIGVTGLGAPPAVRAGFKSVEALTYQSLNRFPTHVAQIKETFLLSLLGPHIKKFDIRVVITSYHCRYRNSRIPHKMPGGGGHSLKNR